MTVFLSFYSMEMAEEESFFESLLERVKKRTVDTDAFIEIC